MFFTLIVQPMINFLTAIHGILPQIDFGIAIIILTILIRLILFPLNWKSIKIQKKMSIVQEKMNQIKNTVKDQEQQAMQIMNLYKTEKVNPFSSCLPLLIQLPFLWAVFMVFRDGLSGHYLNFVYSFVYRPETINTISFGFIDLAKPNVVLAVLAGLAQFWQAKMMTTKRPEVKNEASKDEDMMAMMNKQMLYIMPALTVFIGLSFPGGLALYWLITTVLTALQQLYLFKQKEKI